MSPSGLPFTRSEFLGVFESYNQLAGPLVAILWLVWLATIVRWLRSHPTDSRPLFALLATLWAWSAVVHFAGFFRAISPAAWLFIRSSARRSGWGTRGCRRSGCPVPP
jgi:hypothetical protein